MSKIKLTEHGFEAILDKETVMKNLDNYLAMFANKDRKYYEVHADGVKEISAEEMDKLIALGADLTVNGCPFCVSPCGIDWCAYKEEE